MFPPDAHMHAHKLSKLCLVDLWQVQTCLKGFTIRINEVLTLLLSPFLTHFLQIKLVSQLGHSFVEKPNLHFVLPCSEIILF